MIERDPTDGKPGLRFESAASILLRQTIEQYLHTFSHVIHADRIAGKSVHAEAVNLLAGVVALMIAGKQGSREDLMDGTITKFREYVDRDLLHFATKGRRL